MKKPLEYIAVYWHNRMRKNIWENSYDFKKKQRIYGYL